MCFKSLTFYLLQSMQRSSGNDLPLDITYGMFAIRNVGFFSENIALNKNASQSHPYIIDKISVDASNAVDGLKSNLSYVGQQCVLSANMQNEALWRVDLGEVLGIRHITIYYRTENVPWGKNRVLFCIT